MRTAIRGMWGWWTGMLLFVGVACPGGAAEAPPRRVAEPAGLPRGSDPGPSAPWELWLYVADNLQVAARVTALERLLGRAAAAGYTHLLLADSKFSRLGTVPDFYFEHVARIRAAAASNGVALVPAVFPIGYSNDLLFQDPDLAEGPPVRGVRFEVRGGIARPSSERPPVLRGGDGSNPAAWDWKDDSVAFEDGQVVIRPARGSNSRLVQRLELLPWRQYHLGFRVRSRDFRGPLEVKLLAGQPMRPLNFDHLGVEPSQDWRTHHVVFHSLEFDRATLYLGVWGQGAGECRIDDLQLEETCLVNLIRRPGAPFRVRTETGRELREGTDFEPVQDPRMGRVHWPGDYEVYHEPPAIHLRGDWPNGTVLRVDAQHVASVHDGQVMVDLAEPRVMELLEDQARRMHERFQAGAYLMSHDEIRVLGWSEAFRQRGRTPGELIGDNARAATAVLQRRAPGARVLVWSDMFDPHHNAVPGPYYLVNGSLERAWEGLDPSVVIMNWNHGRRDASLRFFAGRGHRQVIAAYYDNPLSEVDDWLASVRDQPGILGFMYTTWRSDYSQLEAFAARVRRGARP